MANFKIEVEIDWLGEDGSLDATIKDQIIDSLERKISEKAFSEISEETENRINRVIDDLINKQFDAFMDVKVTRTNDWGKVIDEHVSIQSLLQKKLENSLFEKVDKEGRVSSYGQTMTRAEYVLDQRIKKVVDGMTNNIVKQVDERVAAVLNETIKSKLSDSLLAKIDVDGIVKQTVKTLQKG